MILAIVVASILVVAAQGIYRNWDVYRGHSQTFDGFPEHLDEKEEIEAAFPDDSQYTGVFGRIFKWVKKQTKPWLVFGYRSKFSWARWRRTPVVLFVRGSQEGRWRFEKENRELGLRELNKGLDWQSEGWYLSRIQYWKRWHFAVLWPLQITFHRYKNESDVPVFPDRPEKGSLTIRNFFYAYGPIHFDADGLYWLWSFFVGGKWK